jgi:formylglycine-generating enzyme required for sulfatase activity
MSFTRFKPSFQTIIGVVNGTVKVVAMSLKAWGFRKRVYNPSDQRTAKADLWVHFGLLDMVHRIWEWLKSDLGT